MLVDISVEAEAGSRDLRVQAPDTAHLGSVLALLGGPARPLWCDGRPSAPDETLLACSVRTGSVVSSVGPGRGPSTRGLLRLAVVGGPSAGAACELSRRPLLIGRGPSCDVVLDDAEASRFHARLTADRNALVLQDLGSTNGTWIDGRRVETRAPVRPGALIRIGSSHLRVDCGPAATVAATAVAKGPAPRALESRVPGTDPEICLPAEPVLPSPPPVHWLAAAAPALLGGGLALALHNVQFLLFALLSPVVMITTALEARWRAGRSRRRTRQSRRRAREQARGSIAAALGEERRSRHESDPDPVELARIAHAVGDLPVRSPEIDSFLRVRIGLGPSPARTTVRRDGVVASAGHLDAVPLGIDLRRGPVALDGPPLAARGLGRWLVTQLAVLHAADDVQLDLICDEYAQPEWHWIRWLPHFRSVATSSAERGELLDRLADRVDREPGPERLAPMRILLVDARALSAGVAQLHELVRRRPESRLRTLVVGPPRESLGQFASVVRYDGATESSVSFITGVGEVPLTAIADQVSVDWAEGVARGLARRASATRARAQLTDTTPPLSQLLAIRNADDLAQSWSRSGATATAPLGADAAGRPVMIDLAVDGPHALIAGTTGSGKSELLRVLILALAARNPPSELTFALIDYKGGSAFRDCDDLPHVLGVVTDLDGDLIRRVLLSLRAELTRRERLLAAADANDLASYRGLGCTPSLSRLIVVVDEFATLAEEHPALMSDLVGIAQRGRSLGLHLVLATQRPGGAVSPEIRANCTLRLCLRVVDPAESVDVIGGPQAAGIAADEPGHAFARLARGVVELRVADTKAPRGPEPDAVAVEELGPWRRAAGDGRRPVAPTDFDHLSGLIRALSPAGSHPRPALWLPPLPKVIPLASLPVEPNRPVAIGVVDRPARPDQPLLTLDLASGLTAVLAGSARSGRTSALVSMAVAAMLTWSPGDLEVYAIGATAGPLRDLRGWPHVGTVATLDESGTVERLITLLVEECARRQRAQADEGHRPDRPGGPLAGRPLQLVLIDGWETVAPVMAEVLREWPDRVLHLLRHGPPVGQSIVVAGDREVLTGRLATLAEQKYLLRLSDRSDYLLAGLRPSAVPGALRPGQAMRVGDEVLVQFATTTPADRIDPAPPAGTPRSSSLIRVRALPQTVTRAAIHTSDPGYVLGLGGDHCEPIVADLVAVRARLRVAGPAGSGRTTLLGLLAVQALARGDRLIIAAPDRSPLHDLSARVHLRPADPRCELLGADAAELIVVDDLAAFRNTPGAAVLDQLVSGAADRTAVVVTGTSIDFVRDQSAVAHELRRARCALFLNPAPADGEPLGLRLPRLPGADRPGFGRIYGERGWGGGQDWAAGITLQLATP